MTAALEGSINDRDDPLLSSSSGLGVSTSPVSSESELSDISSAYITLYKISSLEAGRNRPVVKYFVV